MLRLIHNTHACFCAYVTRHTTQHIPASYVELPKVRDSVLHNPVLMPRTKHASNTTTLVNLCVSVQPTVPFHDTTATQRTPPRQRQPTALLLRLPDPQQHSRAAAAAHTCAAPQYSHQRAGKARAADSPGGADTGSGCFESNAPAAAAYCAVLCRVAVCSCVTGQHLLQLGHALAQVLTPLQH